MRILLVWPYGFEKTYALPLSLGYLAKSIEGQGHKVKILDCSLKSLKSDTDAFREEVKSFRPNLVGVSAWSILFPEALNVLKVCKSIDSEVVTLMGGPHATSYAQKAIQNPAIDFILRGECEFSFPAFIHLLNDPSKDRKTVPGLVWKNKQQIFQNPMDTSFEMDDLPIPDYDIIQLESYWEQGYRYNTLQVKNAPVWLTRGCPYKCTFCSAPQINGRPVRKHSIEYMERWVSYLYHDKGVRWINILDDNFTYDIEFAKAFCKAMIKLNLKGLGFGTPNGIRMQRGGPELWALMKKAGWKSLIVAPESGSPRILKLMRKNLNLEKVPPIVREIKRTGLTVQGLFLIGYPGESREDLKLTVEFIKKCRFNFVFLNVFQPLPGTPVYDQLVRDGEIEDGLLPNNYSEGTRSYVTPDLVGFNFPLFVLKTYFMMAVRDPLNIPNLFRFFDYKFLAKKLFANFLGIFKSSATQAHINNRVALQPQD